jgi:hypothetical protein
MVTPMAAARTPSDIDLLRRRLDRTAATAAAIRMLGWCGRVACIVVLANAIVAVMAMAGGPLPPGAARLMIIALTICGVTAALRLRADAPPRRLDVAIAAEAATPQLGERLSRAVEFLDDEAETNARGLKHLALADAAAAAATLPRLPVPGIRAHSAWLAAGCGAIACLAAMSSWWPQAGIAPGALRELATDSTAKERSPDAGRLADAAAAIAASAVLESRLAESLSDRFPLSPGVMADDLPPAEARDLDRLARVHDRLAREIGRGRDAVAALAATEPVARAALASLDAIDAAVLDDATAAIASHRLGVATRIVAQTAGALAAAARQLGQATIPADDRSAVLPAAAPPSIRRLSATLAEIEDRPMPAAAAAAAVVVDSSPRPGPAAEGEPSPQTGPAAAGGDAETSGVATTEPRFGTGGGPQETATTPPAAGPVTRAWSRLPARVRPVLPRGTEPDVPPEYRRAVDLYYKSLADTLRNAPTISAPQSRP